jgi:hypothetical protein
MCCPTARISFSRTPLVVGLPPRVLSRTIPGLPLMLVPGLPLPSVGPRARKNQCSLVFAPLPHAPTLLLPRSAPLAHRSAPPTLRSTTHCFLPSLRSQGQLLRRHPRGQALRQRAAAEVRFASPRPACFYTPQPYISPLPNDLPHTRWKCLVRQTTAASQSA